MSVRSKETERLKLRGAYQLLFFVGSVNLLGTKCVLTVQKLYWLLAVVRLEAMVRKR
jgi:hypothetical protein